MIIIFIGPPGAGKGTQAKLLSQKYHLPHFSIGKILREEFEKGTKEGIAAWEYWGKKGINVPSRISFALLKKYFRANKSNFILDNFPRTRANLVDLKRYFKKRNLTVDFVFHLGMRENEGMTRLLKRAKFDQNQTGKKRLDETKPLIKKRFTIGYKKEIGGIIKYFKNQKVLYFINGAKDIRDVNQNIINIINLHDKTKR
ncbi:nucleoside monophosphate kinase [Candidatus Gottesmanbacteria bacterium]|nr:nucleoside monophosphate kinase [Candidatus Gottesmanbacteria bacterium]